MHIFKTNLAIEPFFLKFFQEIMFPVHCLGKEQLTPDEEAVTQMIGIVTRL